MTDAEKLILALARDGSLPDDDFYELIRIRGSLNKEERELLKNEARRKADAVYGKDIYLRGLIEFTNICKNNCLYCGLRRDNREIKRYRLTKEEILDCTDRGYALNFRTFVLQGGEDPHFTDDLVCEIVSEIKERHPDCAITLSIGEKSKESYRRFFEAGAERYLLRHETANEEHYEKLHPRELSMRRRMQCLYDLKEIGYQVGAGFMVGSPGQTDACYMDDFRFLRELEPQMIGIGPFIPHHETPFRECPRGTLEDTLFFLAVLRLVFPEALLPATTALGTIHPLGREMGIQNGANVVMPNLSPASVRGDYLLYDGKICTGDEAAECRRCMELRMEKIGYHVAVGRGDHTRFRRQQSSDFV